MTKQEVMESLLSADSNIPSNVISFIGSNLKDASVDYIPFNHDEDHVFQACGIEESDCKEMTEVLNNYMNTLPKSERQQSKAVEYLVNSGNQKFIRIAVIAGLQKVRENGDDSKSSDLSDLIMKALLKKLKDKDEE